MRSRSLNPYQPQEVAYYVPGAPKLSPAGAIQLNDVFVDDRGIVFMVDRFPGGLYALEMTILKGAQARRQMVNSIVRDPFAGKIPVTIVTGFLGSGKTTLLNHLLSQPELARSAVIVNEHDEQGIDHDLIRFAQEKVLLENGCVCCALRGDLQQILRDLSLARRQGEIGDFERVLLETTGLADPAPVLSDTMLLGQFRVNGVVTCVGAYHALEQFKTHTKGLINVAGESGSLVVQGV